MAGGKGMANLVTLDQIEAHVGIQPNSQDAYLQVLLDACEEWIAQYCGVAFSEATVTERLDGGGQSLRPTRLPVVSVTSVTDTLQSDTLIDATAYRISTRKSRIMREDLDVWDRGEERYQAVYVGGYGGNGQSSIAAPTGLKLCLLEVIGNAYATRRGERHTSSTNQAADFDAFIRGQIGDRLQPYVLGSLV